MRAIDASIITRLSITYGTARRAIAEDVIRTPFQGHSILSKIVIASEARQSRIPSVELDCRASLAMTTMNQAESKNYAARSLNWPSTARHRPIQEAQDRFP
jgi:hypothetical protein